jgi:hypothetical protein
MLRRTIRFCRYFTENMPGIAAGLDRYRVATFGKGKPAVAHNISVAFRAREQPRCGEPALSGPPDLGEFPAAGNVRFY